VKGLAHDILDDDAVTESQEAQANLFLVASEGYIGIFEYGQGNFIVALVNGFQADVKHSGFCHPDIMNILFCFALTVLGKLVHYVCRLMNPATLATGLRKNFSYCFPKT
jgi:hypothetical protein